MSTYMKALRRLERDGQIAPAPAAPARRRAAREAEDAAPRRPAAAAGAAEVEALFERLRTVAAPGAPGRVLVFASVDAPGGARGVVEALAARARELRLAVAVGELTRSGGAAHLAARGGEARPLDLDGPGLAAGLCDWLGAAAAAPLVLIEAPPVSRSVDAVLLGAACDGLVLVAEAGATERGALRAAAARARDGGCRTLGVVLLTRSGT
jgi:hypothetical protein